MDKTDGSSAGGPQPPIVQGEPVIGEWQEPEIAGRSVKSERVPGKPAAVAGPALAAVPPPPQPTAIASGMTASAGSGTPLDMDDARHDAGLIVELSKDPHRKAKIVNGTPVSVKKGFGLGLRPGTSVTAKQAVETLLNRLKTYAEQGFDQIKMPGERHAIGSKIRYSVAELRDLLMQNSWVQAVMKNYPALQSNLDQLNAALPKTR